jgi:hypothetical protein
MPLRIRYRSSDDNVTERVISNETLEARYVIHAHCDLGGGKRTFMLNRIESAVDVETGEEIPDIWLHYGLPSRKPPSLQLPVFSGEPRKLTAEQARLQRGIDEQVLFRRFRLEVIATAKRRRLFGLFGNQCFLCGTMDSLHMEHHVPQSLGGRLVPGNIIVLCRRCTTLKADSHPRDIFPAQKLDRLHSLLKKELQIFDFRINWGRLYTRPKDYLISVGLSEAEAEAAAQSLAPSMSMKLSAPVE